MFVRTGLSGMAAAPGPFTESEDASKVLEEATPSPLFAPPRALPPRPVPAVAPPQAQSLFVIPPRALPPRPVPDGVPPQAQGKPAGGSPGPSAAPLLLSALAFLLFRGNA